MKNETSETETSTARERDDASILRERARALARRPQAIAATDGSIELLEFLVGDQRYGIETRHVTEAMPLADLTPLPGVPAFVAGIANVRGLLTAVIDLRQLLDVPVQGISDLDHLVLVSAQGLELALLANAILGVHRHPLASISPPLTGARPSLLRGITAERLLVLHGERLLADPRLHDIGAPDQHQQQQPG